MADLAKRLCGPVLLPATAATQYTVPASTQTILKHLHVVNNSSSVSYGFSLSIGVLAAGTILFSVFPISPLGVLDWSGFIVLNAGDIVQALGSTANQLNLTMSGIEVTS